MLPSWPQDGTKSKKYSKNHVRGSPRDPQVGGQNPSKIDLKAMENDVNFLISFGIDFLSIFIRFGSQLGLNMEPKSIKNRYKN